MSQFVILSLFIFTVAVTMTMVGKGGGNFYIIILTVAGIPMYEAAATGQFILFAASVAALLVFHKHKSLSWKLAFFIGTFTALAAFCGGYFSHLFSNYVLKLIFAGLLFVSGLAMLFPFSTGKQTTTHHWGVITINYQDIDYSVNLLIALPVAVIAGFASGMVGVSGGSFLVPLMVLACGVPMYTAVGTASILITITAAMGFTGHAVRGDFNPHLAIPLAVIAVIGGIIGSKLALQSRPKNLKKLFAYSNWIAALFMIFNALHTGG